MREGRIRYGRDGKQTRGRVEEWLACFTGNLTAPLCVFTLFFFFLGRAGKSSAYLWPWRSPFQLCSGCPQSWGSGASWWWPLGLAAARRVARGPPDGGNPDALEVRKEGPISSTHDRFTSGNQLLPFRMFLQQQSTLFKQLLVMHRSDIVICIGTDIEKRFTSGTGNNMPNS